MTTDRIFVLMLVIMLPMSGCFGAVDNADAEENDSDTIVNNYYNNTTHTPVIEKFSVGGVIDFNSTDYTEDPTNDNYRAYTPYNFTTVAGEFVSVHYLQTDNFYGTQLTTVCDDGSNYYMSSANINQESGLWGSYTNCVHTVELTLRLNNYLDSHVLGWNLVYSIESVTVI
jgi:hypothetical protein